MGIWDRLFGGRGSKENRDIVRNTPNPVAADITGIQRDEAYSDTQRIPQLTDYVAQMIVSMVRHETQRPAVNLLPTDDAPSITDTKVGGAFYVPPAMGVPKNRETGEPLFLIAQLNFAQLPHLHDFPQDGLLQFFIAGDDSMFGKDFDRLDSQRSWRIRYIPEPDDVTRGRIIRPHWKDDTDLPLHDPDVEFRLEPQLATQAMSTTDFRFESTLQRYLGALNDRDRDFFDTHDADIRDTLNDMLGGDGLRVGGYPVFTQDDPREDDPDLGRATTLLLQLDSLDDNRLMFGDTGVMNFFIEPDRLRRLDFSRVLYTWDCY
ncbi:DUF1963 domain-containing protein [Bifidobacterium sp. SMB2]|uniref:DUF1963 domain-containing protein n=1 Tax=Bifidobacterium saimiriisciurei TaxID=2661627 RepID=A0ABX0CAY3_9BIFI|nr:MULTISPECIES: DUF1963 domain-containing protein [Bifidobacterium]NEG95913.1 DUF1963 domain-containing protein [Bifidobacterium sp. SMB2]NEH11760.1 DUF1963 domain-containing protein [Bifidobacterium saimiriisciurei]